MKKPAAFLAFGALAFAGFVFGQAGPSLP